MARVCALCGKKPHTATTRKLLRGNYNPTGTHRQKPNLQPRRTEEFGKILVCTQCIKTKLPARHAQTA